MTWRELEWMAEARDRKQCHLASELMAMIGNAGFNAPKKPMKGSDFDPYRRVAVQTMRGSLSDLKPVFTKVKG